MPKNPATILFLTDLFLFNWSIKFLAVCFFDYSNRLARARIRIEFDFVSVYNYQYDFISKIKALQGGKEGKQPVAV